MKAIVLQLCVLGILSLTGCKTTQTKKEAPSITDQLKVADCNFKIFLGDKKVEVLNQAITLRAASYHLEFSYTGAEIYGGNGASVEFYDQNKKVYWSYIQDEDRYMGSGRSSTIKPNHFAINLEDIPLFLLDEVVSVKIKTFIPKNILPTNSSTLR